MKVTIPACVYGKQQGRERAPLEYLVTAPALEKWKTVLLRTIRFQWRSGASGDPETYPDVWFMAPVPGEEGRAFLCCFEDAGRDPRPHTLRSTSGLCTKEHMPLLVAIKQGRARVVSPSLPDGGLWEFEYEPSASAEELPWEAQYLSEGNRGTYDLSFTDEAFAPAPRAEAAAPRTSEPLQAPKPPTARKAAESSARRAPEEPERPGLGRRILRWCITVLVALLVVALGVVVYLRRDAVSELETKTEQLARVESELETMKAHQAQEQAQVEQIKDILRAIQKHGEDMERKGREMRERAGELLNALQQAKRPHEEKADPATRSSARSGERTRPREAGPSPTQPEQDEQPEPPPAQPEPAPSAAGEPDGEQEEEAASQNESDENRSSWDRFRGYIGVKVIVPGRPSLTLAG